MMNALKFHHFTPYKTFLSLKSPSFRCPHHLRLPIRRHTSLTLQSLPDPPPPPSQSEPSTSPDYITFIGSSSSSSYCSHSHLNFTQRQIVILNVIACAAAVSATWLFISAIPTLLAFKRAAESLEKLMDATREELPDTMAAIRLSGMEISDLTMELSDLGQEITQGVKSSTRAVRIAEERLRGLTNMPSPPPPPPSALLQTIPRQKTETGALVVARTAKGIKEGIVRGRAILQLFFTFTHYSRLALNYFRKQAKK
ncbi:uncharacterized protein LOC8274919 isoform X1 [Ricinus communis]|uniref:uncharacterized protein LOC8274919 isoform X1 n=1 Tax=Ricinus communis TaxID=3988 RepID=UPI00201A4BC5|nr:uncharacterized protein LOC8274919 isoform X1 [Ricinus communis]XP_025014802.2 uncharacterized protein LOC8274919 isoform X1 [Ricinus communis]